MQSLTEAKLRHATVLWIVLTTLAGTAKCQESACTFHACSSFWSQRRRGGCSTMGRGAATASPEELALEKYLPTPYPLQRLRPESGGGFLAPEPATLSHQHFRSYGEWFEAQQPLWKKLPPKPLSRVQSTALWPYGRHVSQLTGSLAKSDAMSIDGRLVESTQPYVPPAMEKSSSSPALGTRSGQQRPATFVGLGSHEE
eukprot:4293708-Amphidinium_carterae.2